jgi:hypothetical protein
MHRAKTDFMAALTIIVKHLITVQKSFLETLSRGTADAASDVEALLFP